MNKTIHLENPEDSMTNLYITPEQIFNQVQKSDLQLAPLTLKLGTGPTLPFSSEIRSSSNVSLCPLGLGEDRLPELGLHTVSLEDTIASTEADAEMADMMELMPVYKRKLTASVPNIAEGLGKRQESKDFAALEEFIIQKQKWAVCHGDIYWYSGSYWIKCDERRAVVELRDLLTKANLDNSLRRADYTELYRRLLTNKQIQMQGDFPVPQHKINLVDGTLDIANMVFMPHNPDDGFLSELDLSYSELIEPEQGETFESFVTSISDEDPDVRRQMLELLGLALTGYEIKNFYVLLGPSNTGKTQFGRFIQELLGRENVQCVASVTDFEGRFTTSSLAGKQLAMCLDLPDAPLPQGAIGAIKQFVGDDPVKAEQKYKDSYTLYRKPLLLLAGNHPVRIPDISEEKALLNRMVVIPFRNPVEPADQKQHLYIQLGQEAPYIVAEAVKAYRDLLHRGFTVTRSRVPEEFQCREAKDEILAVRYFIQNACVLDADAETSTDEMHLRYKQMASDGAFPELTMTKFSKVLKQELRTVGDVAEEQNVRREHIRGYRGIRLL